MELLPRRAHPNVERPEPEVERLTVARDDQLGDALKTRPGSFLFEVYGPVSGTITIAGDFASGCDPIRLDDEEWVQGGCNSTPVKYYDDPAVQLIRLPILAAGAGG